MDSIGNSEQAVIFSRGCVKVLKLTGFVLTKSASTVEKVTYAMIPEVNETFSSVKEIFYAEQFSHVLGLKWHHAKDALFVSRRVDRALTKTITQRTFLSFVASVFDPFGLVGTYAVGAHLYLRHLAITWPKMVC